jgi:hypothetical protein
VEVEFGAVARGRWGGVSYTVGHVGYTGRRKRCPESEAS